MSGEAGQRTRGKVRTRRFAFDDQLIRLEVRNMIQRPPGDGDGVLYRLLKIVIHRKMKIPAGDGDAARFRHPHVPAIVEPGIA